MIGTVMMCSWLNLKRDKVALGLTFVLPVVFFSIFAAIFGGMGGDEGGARPITVAVVNVDGSDFSRRFIAGMEKQPSLKVILEVKGEEGKPAQAYTEETAQAAVRSGKVNTAVLLLPGMADAIGFGGASEPAVRLIHDPSNPMAQHTVRGLLQSVGMSASPTVQMDRGLGMLEQFGGPLTETQRNAVAMFKQTQASADSGGLEPVPVEVVSVHEDNEKGGDGPDLVAYYAAGIGVMFLLFSMSGAGGGLLEEEESGTLDRLMISRLGMNRLILGKWLFFTLLGITQLTVMFTWGALVFGLDLFTVKHLLGFVVVTVPLCFAGAAFGLLLATLSKSRAQLSGMSTIIILVMSALGGSMVPRFVMPAYMDVAARFTLNGWAIDAFLKIFWREDPSHSLVQSLLFLLPEVGALLLIGACLLGLAIWFSKRWEAV